MDELPVATLDSQAPIDELTVCLTPMLRQLPAKYAQAIEFIDYQGFSQQDLAVKVGISVSGAKSRVQRARLLLKGLLAACCQFEFDVKGNVMDYHPKLDNCNKCQEK